jgi:hypothetical protein
MATLPPLATLDDLKAAIRDPESFTDTDLNLALKRASGRFRGQVRHPVSLVENDQIVLDGTGTRTLQLPAAPITDITVTLAGRLLEEGPDFEVSRRNGILRRAGGRFWPDGLENVAVTYTHGYDPIPDDVADAVLEHATTLAMVYAHIQQEGAGSVQATYGAAATVGTTQKWADAVENYRLKGRA